MEEESNPDAPILKMGNWNTRRSRVRVRHASRLPTSLSQPSWPPRTTKRLLPLLRNSSLVCLGFDTNPSSADLSRLLAGLDNLPSEISFLLTEIQHIDVRSQGRPRTTSSLRARVSHNPFKNFSKRLPKKLPDISDIPVDQLLVLHRTRRTPPSKRRSKSIMQKSKN